MNSHERLQGRGKCLKRTVRVGRSSEKRQIFWQGSRHPPGWETIRRGQDLLYEAGITEALGGHNMIKKDKTGYKVVSEKGKNLGSGYKTRAAAAKRLRQVEYFKHKKG
jgi:hypothetical protein